MPHRQTTTTNPSSVCSVENSAALFAVGAPTPKKLQMDTARGTALVQSKLLAARPETHGVHESPEFRLRKLRTRRDRPADPAARAPGRRRGSVRDARHLADPRGVPELKPLHCRPTSATMCASIL